jgi:hypothetical protein
MSKSHKPPIPEWYQYQRGTGSITSSQDNITLSQKSNKKTGKNSYQQTLNKTPTSNSNQKGEILTKQFKFQGMYHLQYWY